MSKNTSTAAVVVENTPKAKKVKKVRVAYPIPEGGLTAWPADWNRKVHKPLRKKDFSDEMVYLEVRAKQIEAKANAFRQEAELIKQFGDVETRRMARQLVRCLQRASLLGGQLEALGIDVETAVKTFSKKK